MRHRTTSILLVLFFAGLSVLWYADYAHVLSRVERQNMSNRLLPELIDTPLTEIVRLEIDRIKGETLVVEREEGGRWQMRKPVVTAADSETVDTLVRTLKNLGRSVDAGTIEGDVSAYGLSPAETTVKLFIKGSEAPVILEVGKSLRERVYVRPGAGAGVEVVDARLLSPLSRKAVAWRDTSLFRIPSFRVEGVTIDEKDSKNQIQVQRGDRNWRLIKPYAVPADDDKIEGLVGELSALRVADDEQGFIEDDVHDLAKFGLDHPFWKIALSPFAKSGKVQSVSFGNRVPEQPDQVYAMRGDQDEVIRVDVKRLREAITGANALRSQKVLDFTPTKVSRVRLDAQGTLFELARTLNGWNLLSPSLGPADSAAIESLLMRLSDLKASEFFEASQIGDPKVDKPNYRVQIWQTSRRSPTTDIAASEEELKVNLSFGRNDLLKKSIYARVEGDPTILAIPDEILKEFPRNLFAFRDRTVLSLKPEHFSKISVERPTSRVTIIPNGLSGQGMKSRMIEPIDAPTDESAVTLMMLALANLRTESWENDKILNAATYGLDSPWLRIHWFTEPPTSGTPIKAPRKHVDHGGTLRIGKMKRGTMSFYANLESEPRVFTLNSGVVAAFEAELHDHSVHSFKPETAQGITLEWPSRTLSLIGSARTASTPIWTPRPGYDSSRFDFSTIAPLITFFSDLKTSRYLQYTGPIRESAGLIPPRLTIRMSFAGNSREAILRIGNTRSDGTCFATTASGDDGSVFLLVPGEPLKALLATPGRMSDLPDDPFAPLPNSPNAPSNSP